VPNPSSDAGTAPDRDDRDRRLVAYVVRRLGSTVTAVFDDDDAMQVGMLGLLAARDAYRADAGASFETYAIVRIRGAILDAIRALDPIGRPRREAARAIADASSSLAVDLGRDPTDNEVATHLGMTVERCVEIRRIGSITAVSLEVDRTTQAADHRASLGDTIADPAAVDPMDRAARSEELSTLVHEVSLLGERKQQVIALYYRDELTFREIARALGVSESRACQIHRSALNGLRARLTGAQTKVATAAG
jgi:RNA polymerase sigma factor for flagellar operon FliA